MNLSMYPIRFNRQAGFQSVRGLKLCYLYDFLRHLGHWTIEIQSRLFFCGFINLRIYKHEHVCYNIALAGLFIYINSQMKLIPN